MKINTAIMDTVIAIQNNSICCACLCEDDNLFELKNNHILDLFSTIINLNPLDSSNDNKYLTCWRCRALLRKYYKFTQQVKQSYTLFWNYNRKKLNINEIKREPVISKHQQFNIDASKFLLNGIKPVDIVKNELVDELDVLDTTDFGDSSTQELETNDIDNVGVTPVIDKNNRRIKQKKTKVNLNIEKSKTTADIEELISQNIELNAHIEPIISKKRKKKKKHLWLAIEYSEEQIKEERRNIKLEELYLDAVFKCEGCLEIFGNRDDYEQHLKEKHDESRPNKCEICQKTFINMNVLNVHIKRHKTRSVCMVCGKIFRSPKQVMRHIEWEHYRDSVKAVRDTTTPKPSDTRLICEICNKTFLWKSSLRKHMEKHTIEAGHKRTPYCETCRISFTSSSSLQKHLKTSSKHEISLKIRNIVKSSEITIKPAKISKIVTSVNRIRATFPCDMCDKQFQWRGNLSRHMLSHKAKAEGNLKCDPCNKTFSSLATYQQHMKLSKRHASENDYKFICADCGEKFMSKTKLSDHINWEHLKKYSYKCHICDKVFKSHTCLYIHKQVVHKNGKVRLCDHCGKSFHSSTKLRTHVKAVHTDKTQYVCDICNATFAWQSCWSRHKRIVHGKGGKSNLIK